MHGDAVTSTKEAIVALDVDPNEQALQPVNETEVYPDNVDPFLNRILIVKIAKKS